MSRDLTLKLRVDPDYDDPDAALEALEDAVTDPQIVRFLVSGYEFHCVVVEVSAESWTQQVTSQQIFG